MLIKTEKGRQELRPGTRTLDQRARAILLLADGPQSEAQMGDLFGGEGRQVIESLLASGYLERRDSAAPAITADARRVAQAVAAPTPVDRRATAPPIPEAAHGEAFSGTRSLATARMFLFDLSERLFAPRNKALADRYRDALREARDPQAMLAVGRALIADVEALAGAERADGISERLAKLLPLDLLEQQAA